jgi:hypothetical protein
MKWLSLPRRTWARAGAPRLASFWSRTGGDLSLGRFIDLSRDGAAVPSGPADGRAICTGPVRLGAVAGGRERAHSSAVEHSPYKRGVAGSNPAAPTTFRLVRGTNSDLDR